MRMFVIATIATIIVSMMTPTVTAESTYSPYLIEDDYGGMVGTYNAEFAIMEASHRPVVIKGMCMSACTRYMKLSRVCALPDAVFGFHASRNAETEKLMIEAGRRDMQEHLLPAAYALVIRYKAYTFGFEANYKGPEYQKVAPGIRIYHHPAELFGLPSHQRFLMVQASKLVRNCPMRSL